MTDKRLHRYSGIGVYGMYKAEEADALFESLEAELLTVMDRAERYMDLCARKDEEIAQLKEELNK